MNLWRTEFSGSAQNMADFQSNVLRVDKCNMAQVTFGSLGQAMRFAGITSEKLPQQQQWKESRASPVKHASVVSFRLDIHDHY